MIRQTMREPLCDIGAQYLALMDWAHPKTAMWVSWGTPRPDFEAVPNLYVFDISCGTLATHDPAKAQFFDLSPTEDALAAVLGYTCNKDGLDPERAVVVQATDLAGSVITEQAVGFDGADRAVEALKSHGQIRVIPLVVAAWRREALIKIEDQ